mmetsp:Transcript_27838/g.82563  ORF Transcript_27838/g.82563 Transcript_27838/m.82563 type:complete len:328 (-) Transcript_27838:982-1965(-)
MPSPSAAKGCSSARAAPLAPASAAANSMRIEPPSPRSPPKPPPPTAACPLSSPLASTAPSSSSTSSSSSSSRSSKLSTSCRSMSNVLITVRWSRRTRCVWLPSSPSPSSPSTSPLRRRADATRRSKNMRSRVWGCSESARGRGARLAFALRRNTRSTNASLGGRGSSATGAHTLTSLAMPDVANTSGCHGCGSRQLTTCVSPCISCCSRPVVLSQINTCPQSLPLTTYSSSAPKKLHPLIVCKLRWPWKHCSTVPSRPLVPASHVGECCVAAAADAGALVPRPPRRASGGLFPRNPSSGSLSRSSSSSSSPSLLRGAAGRLESRCWQ